MRILFVNHYFQPEPNFFVGLPFAKKMVEFGHEVEVLTGFPNYPGGKIYDGYRIRPLMRETMEGIPINRVPLYPSHDRSAFRRALCYTSLALSASTIGVAAVKKADVAYVSQGPATIGLPACILRLIRGIPFVYDIKDLWPDAMISTDMFDSRLGAKLVGAWCNFVYKRAGKIVVITPGVKQTLCRRGVPEEKIEMIYEWCDDSHICYGKKDTQLAKALGMEGRFNIVFAGNMGKAQSLGSVIEAAKLLASEHPKAQFVFIGGGVEVGSLKQKVTDMDLKNVIFHKRRPITEIGSILQLADVLLVHLKDDPLFRIAIPSKIQAYMASGQPILIGVRGNAAELVEKAQAGLSCEPDNPASIADAVRKFLTMSKQQRNQMGQNGKNFYQRELAFDIGARRYEKIFEAVSKTSKEK